MKSVARLATVALFVGAMTAACGTPEPEDFVGRWESTSSEAWIEIADDMTFAAHDYPVGLAAGAQCGDREAIERTDWVGFMDTSTLEAGFLYVDGGSDQLFVDYSLAGRRQLSVAICIEDFYEDFERVD